MPTSSPWLRRPLAAALAAVLALSVVPAARATAETVVADNGSGNGIASGAVVRAAPDSALVTVTNGFHFWAALDVTYVGNASLQAAKPNEDLGGGIYAGAGLIGPNGTAAWDGHFAAASQALVRVHYDLTSAGGAAALAANLLTIIADSLGASLSASSSSRLLTALQAVTGMSGWIDLLHQAQTNDIWGLVSSIEVMLGSQIGRDTIRYALGQLGVIANDADLAKAASVVGIIDWAWTLFDIYRAVLLGQNDGTVIFSVAPPLVTQGPTPTATPTATPMPTPRATNSLTLASVQRTSSSEAEITLQYTYGGTPPPTQANGEIFVTCEGAYELDPRFSNNPGAIGRGSGRVTVRLVYVSNGGSVSTTSLFCAMFQDGAHPLFYTVSLPYSTAWSPQSPTATSTPPAASLPLWVQRVRDDPISPGVGLAGVSLGEPQQSVVDWLGDAALAPYPVKDSSGSVLYYALMHTFGGLFLGVYITPDSHTVQRLRLDDSSFNSSALVPRVNGISIGSTGSALVQAFGAPQSTLTHSTCPQSLGDRSTTTYTYTGISFWVCQANSLVYLMDVP